SAFKRASRLDRALAGVATSGRKMDSVGNFHFWGLHEFREFHELASQARHYMSALDLLVVARNVVYSLARNAKHGFAFLFAVGKRGRGTIRQGNRKSFL